MTEDPRLISPEKRYEGFFTRMLGRIASVAIFLAFFALIGFMIAKLMSW